MQVGGNANASSFFHQHGCATKDTNAKYNSRAAQLYREKIKTLATQATRRHGTDLWLDSCAAPPMSPPPKEEDFFCLSCLSGGQWCYAGICTARTSLVNTVGLGNYSRKTRRWAGTRAKRGRSEHSWEDCTCRGFIHYKKEAKSSKKRTWSQKRKLGSPETDKYILH